MRLLGMERADDRAIWVYAKEYDFVIVTQDSDFNGVEGVKYVVKR